ncbi:hypothetical protein TPA4_66 [Tsukamurella phage TPA4]|nr:hypothetical protein BH784_gp66 [Tsukamurella phage TPA4]AKJ72231.1 hypothetical protein TPA4_66 [Tsukamurella phage TPA4]
MNDPTARGQRGPDGLFVDADFDTGRPDPIEYADLDGGWPDPCEEWDR